MHQQHRLPTVSTALVPDLVTLPLPVPAATHVYTDTGCSVVTGATWALRLSWQHVEVASSRASVQVYVCCLFAACAQHAAGSRN
jgi:hypothetical protein